MEVWLSSKKRYGSPKISKCLFNKGIKVSQKRVSRRMKVLNIHSITIKKYKPYSSSKIDSTKQYPNLLKQNFKASKPSLKWVGDITYIYTIDDGWTYLATVMDLFDLKIIGYCYDKHMSSDITINALKMAVSKRPINDNLIFHSDRGSQYTSKAFETLLKDLNIKHSFSKKGYPYDNASMESFNSILKKELVYTKSFRNYQKTKLELFEYIESWYHNTRIHGSLDYLTPNEVYNNYILSLNPS